MQKLLLAMVVVFSMGMTGSVFAQDFQKGLKAYDAKDYAAALKEFRILAERGHAGAQHKLGWMYLGGFGVLKDVKESVFWVRKAAEQGDAEAQASLAMAYEFGHGVIKDNVYTHAWYNIASANGYMEASIERNEIEKKMTAAEIAKAQELARECVKKNYKGC